MALVLPNPKYYRINIPFNINTTIIFVTAIPEFVVLFFILKKSTMQKITPFLWFNNKAEEAMNFYVSIFKNSKIIRQKRMGDNGPLFTGTFEIDGQQFHVINGGPMFTFSEAISLFVNCETQQEVDELWEKLSEGGQKKQCAWLTDKYGISWQIVPKILGELLGDKDAKKVNRVVDAMLHMTKIDISKLVEAANKPD